MSVVCERVQGGILHVILNRNVEATDVDTVNSDIRRLFADARPESIIVDASRTVSFGSYGLMSLMRLSFFLPPRSKTVVIVNPTRFVHKLFVIAAHVRNFTGLRRTDSVDEAHQLIALEVMKVVRVELAGMGHGFAVSTM